MTMPQLYISIGEIVYFIHQCPSNHPLYTYSENIYNGIQGTGQAFDKTIRLGMGVFSVATHMTPLPGADTAFLDLVFEYPLTMATAHHTAAGLDL